MTVGEPTIDLAERFSSPGATARPWSEASDRLEQAELYWLSTVRPDGRPHVTPLIAVWADERLYFCTGSDERKAKNIATNPSCVLTTGCNTLHQGLDVVVEGEAVNVRDDARLQVIADAYVAKYGEEWTFTVAGGEFHLEGDGSPALVFEVTPTTVLAFGKGEPYSQTRYRF
jgi:nitroimidazol reductase NimA-like FMN-containing flavoprotein (pyridoxamine 5'-phosphate oxidase superfamily)